MWQGVGWEKHIDVERDIDWLLPIGALISLEIRPAILDPSVRRLMLLLSLSRAGQDSSIFQ